MTLADKLQNMVKNIVENLEITEYIEEPETKELKTYKADYEDDNFEVITAYSDEDAFDEALSYEYEHGALFNVFEVDEDNYYEEVREVRAEELYKELTIDIKEKQKIKNELKQALIILGEKEYKDYMEWTATEVTDAKDNLETIKRICKNQDEIKRYENILEEKEIYRDIATEVWNERTKNLREQLKVTRS